MANGINKAILVGRLGGDPEVRHLEGGSIVARLNLATTESYKNRNGERVDETEWHTVTFWGRTAEVAEKYLKKGDMIYVEGRIRTRKWEDKEGNTRYTTEIVGQNMTMLGSKGDRPEGGSQQATPPAQNTTQESAPADNTPPADDDLPF
jgi:single-strand DNA-binding protein